MGRNVPAVVGELPFRLSFGEDAVGLMVVVAEEKSLPRSPWDGEVRRRLAPGGGVPIGRGGVLEPEEPDDNDCNQVRQHVT